MLFLITCALTWFSHNQYQSSQKLIEEVEYYDSLNRYNKIYYSKAFSSLRKENEELNKIKNYYDINFELSKKKIELMKCRLNIISDINFKKSSIPTFKSKNPISNLDININLFDPKEES